MTATTTLDLDAIEQRVRAPKAYDAGDEGMRRLLRDHMTAVSDCAALVAAVRKLLRERDETRAAYDLVTASLEGGAGNPLPQAVRERDEWREKYECVTTYSAKAGNVLMDAAIQKAVRERDAAQAALAEERAKDAPRLARRVELENECARLDARAIVARVAQAEAQAGLVALHDAMEAMGVAIWEFEHEQNPRTYDARTAAAGRVAEALAATPATLSGQVRARHLREAAEAWLDDCAAVSNNEWVGICERCRRLC